MTYSEKTQTIECNLFGKSFNLRCADRQKKSLQEAIESLQQKASAMMRENPSLTPDLAAILIAIDAESSLIRERSTQRPFEKKAQQLMEKMKAELIRVKNV
ncbi:MAG: cell division protein ZapA [Succinivibrio sp.]